MKYKLTAVAIVLGVCGGFVFGVYYAYARATEITQNAYAADWASEFIIQHLKSNDNQWPTGWADLRDEFDTAAAPGHYPWSWEELQARVVVRWDAVPATLAKADGSREPPFDMIRLSDGSANYWFGGEPNRKVFDYLQTTELAD